MNAFEKIAFWVMFIGIAIVKLPITLIVAVGLWIEETLMGCIAQLAAWYGDESLIEGVNLGIELTAEASQRQSEDYLELKIEL